MRFRYWLAIATVIFAAGLAAGLSISGSWLAELIDTMLAQFPTIQETGVIFGISSTGLFIFILVKNLLAMGFSFVFAPFFGIMPALSLFLNGALISYVASSVAEQESPGYVFSLLAPHGIIEIPAFLVAQAAALSFGAAAVYALFTRDRDRGLILSFRKNLKILLIAMAFLFPAAAIETFVTPLFAR